MRKATTHFHDGVTCLPDGSKCVRTQSCASRLATVQFWRWFYTSPVAASMAARNGFASLPGPVAAKVLQRLLGDILCDAKPVYVPPTTHSVRGLGFGALSEVLSLFISACAAAAAIPSPRHHHHHLLLAAAAAAAPTKAPTTTIPPPAALAASPQTPLSPSPSSGTPQRPTSPSPSPPPPPLPPRSRPCLARRSCAATRTPSPSSPPPPSPPNRRHAPLQAPAAPARLPTAPPARCTSRPTPRAGSQPRGAALRRHLVRRHLFALWLGARRAARRMDSRASSPLSRSAPRTTL